MEAILLKDHEKLGTKGHVVRVKPGYMRHTLYPNRQAVYATDENIIRYTFLDFCCRHVWPVFQREREAKLAELTK